MQLIDGKATATAIKAQIAEEVKSIVANGGSNPIWQQCSSVMTAALKLMSRTR